MPSKLPPEELVVEDAGSGPTLASSVGEQLKRDVLECRLEPGMRLRLLELKARYGVGMSPLREALMKLAVEGLVVLEDRRGFRVAPVSRSKLLDITFMRRELETKAISLSITHGDQAWLDEVEQACERLSGLRQRDAQGAPNEDWEVAHRAYHSVLGAACQSEWLIYFRALLYDQWDRYRRLWNRIANAEPQRDIQDEHRQLAMAVLDRDADLAISLIQRHISASAKQLLNAPAMWFEKD